MRGLAKESADRYPNVLAFASALRAAVQGDARRRSRRRSASRRRSGRRRRSSCRCRCGAPPRTGRRRSRRHPAGAARRGPRHRPPDSPDALAATRTPRRFVLLALAVAAALAWFSPSTRMPTRAAWHQARHRCGSCSTASCPAGRCALKVHDMARTHERHRIGDLPTQTIPAVPEHLSMGAARKVAALKQVGELFVEREGRLVGVLGERALAEAADDGRSRRRWRPSMCVFIRRCRWRAREKCSCGRGASMLPVDGRRVAARRDRARRRRQAVACPCAAPRRRVSRVRAAA